MAHRGGFLCFMRRGLIRFKLKTELKGQAALVFQCSQQFETNVLYQFIGIYIYKSVRIKSMYQKNICLNTKTWVAYSTGNQGYRDLLNNSNPTADDVRHALYIRSIKRRQSNNANDNYNHWSKSVKRDGLDFFFVVSVKAETMKEANVQAKKIISDNGWKEASKQTYATEV